jgi:hypothetical protein
MLDFSTNQLLIFIFIIVVGLHSGRGHSKLAKILHCTAGRINHVHWRWYVHVLHKESSVNVSKNKKMHVIFSYKEIIMKHVVVISFQSHMVMFSFKSQWLCFHSKVSGYVFIQKSLGYVFIPKSNNMFHDDFFVRKNNMHFFIFRYIYWTFFV